MRLTSILFFMAIAGMVLTAIGAAPDATVYLKDGKLKGAIEVAELQGGFAGFTGTYYAIDADGSWSTGPVLPPRQAKGEAKSKGKLTAEQLAQLAKVLASNDLLKLPNHGVPAVNPQVVRIRFGEKMAELQPGAGDGAPKTDKAIRARYAAVVDAVKELCKDKDKAD